MRHFIKYPLSLSFGKGQRSTASEIRKIWHDLCYHHATCNLPSKPNMRFNLFSNLPDSSTNMSWFHVIQLLSVNNLFNSFIDQFSFAFIVSYSQNIWKTSQSWNRLESEFTFRLLMTNQRWGDLHRLMIKEF